jgi:uncharacterized membrane protein
MGESYNAWRLVSLSPWPPWALVLIGAIALAGVVLAWRGLRRETRAWRRRLLVTLRTLSMLAALFVVLEPGVRLLQTSRVKNRVAVLVDGSASMAFPTSAGGPTRAAAAAAWLQKVRPELQALEDRYTVEYLRFDRDVAPADPTALAEGKLEPKGERTDLVAAARGPAAGGGRKLVGVVLVSDGADNVQLPTSQLAGKPREALESLQVPVSAVSLGGADLRDIAVEDVKVDDFAFVRNTVTVEARLTATGFEGRDVPVVLRREGQVVAQQSVKLQAGQRDYPLSFSFVPDQIGEFVFTVAAPAYEGEAITANNSRSFVLKVIRDRVRTLLVVGQPSWDERFLRVMLKNDPNVDLISFFILRTPQDDQTHARENELSLIPFPVDEIFDKQLKSFDLVIFLNFAYRPYRMESYLPNIRDYVMDGGAFVMIGGENSFGEGGYATSPLAEILPVTPTGQPPDEGLFSPVLSDQGARHPITQLVPGLEANRALWAGLPPVPGVNVTQAKPEAQVLLEHPSLHAGSGPAPVLAVMQAGRGRSMALTTDSSWYWSMVAAGKTGGTPRAYERFWSGAIRWLVRDPELTPVKIQAVADTLEPGDPVAAVVTARRGDYGPASGAEVQVQLVLADGGQVVATQRATAAEDGSARVELQAPGPGAYELRATASLGGALLGSDQDAVAVRAASAERSDARPRPELLQEIARLTGGGFVEASEGKLPDLHLPDPEVVEVGRSKDRPIWDRFWSLAALATFLASEWFLRRRWGFF